MSTSLKRLASMAVIACAAAAALASPALAQPPQAASAKPGYADPDGVPPRPPAVDIEPVYRKPAIDTLATILKRGVLRVGVAPAEPFVMRDANGELAGFSIDLGRKVAEESRRAGVVRADDVVADRADLLGNQFDVIFSGMWITPARALVMNFTESTSVEAVQPGGRQAARGRDEGARGFQPPRRADRGLRRHDPGGHRGAPLPARPGDSRSRRCGPAHSRCWTARRTRPC